MSHAHVRDTTIEKNGNLHLEGLPLPSGARVQVVVIEKKDRLPNAPRYPLQGEPFQYDDPFGPATDPEDWEANR